jgi:hypothetical protein
LLTIYFFIFLVRKKKKKKKKKKKISTFFQPFGDVSTFFSLSLSPYPQTQFLPRSVMMIFDMRANAVPSLGKKFQDEERRNE